LLREPRGDDRIAGTIHRGNDHVIGSRRMCVVETGKVLVDLDLQPG
jgi:hypothetical protein